MTCGFNDKSTTDAVVLKIQTELDKLIKTTNAQFLLQSNKICELYNYIKGGLKTACADFLYELKSKGELDDIITSAVTSAIELQQIKTSYIVNVKEFGAKGDGFTDDTQAIRNALSVHGDESCVVLFPTGTYVVSDNVELYSNTILDLNNSTILTKGTTLFLNNENSVKFVNDGYCMKNITIKNGAFKGEGTNILKLSLMKVDNVHIEDILFDGCHYGNHAIELGGCKDVFIERCRFTNVSLNDAYQYVELIQTEYASYNGMPYWNEKYEGYDDLPCKNVVVAYCSFEKGAYGTHYPNAIGGHGFFASQHNGLTVHHCTFNNWTYACIRPLKWTNINIHDNTFYANDDGTVGAITIESAYDTAYGFIASDNIKICNNVFKAWHKTKRRFIYITGHNADNQHGSVLISGNEYKGTYDEVDSTSGSDFVQIDYVRNVLIFGNIIHNAKNVVFASNTLPIVFKANNVVGCRTMYSATVQADDDGSVHAITGTTARFNVSGTNRDFTFESYYKKGNKIQPATDNSALIIGKGVTQVKVSALFFMEYGSGFTCSIMRKRNGSAITVQSCACCTEEGSNSACIPCYILNVQENDELYLTCPSGNSGTIFSNKTYLTVEVI